MGPGRRAPPAHYGWDITKPKPLASPPAAGTWAAPGRVLTEVRFPAPGGGLGTRVHDTPSHCRVSVRTVGSADVVAEPTAQTSLAARAETALRLSTAAGLAGLGSGTATRDQLPVQCSTSEFAPIRPTAQTLFDASADTPVNFDLTARLGLATARELPFQCSAHSELIASSRQIPQFRSGICRETAIFHRTGESGALAGR